MLLAYQELLVLLERQIGSEIAISASTVLVLVSKFLNLFFVCVKCDGLFGRRLPCQMRRAIRRPRPTQSYSERIEDNRVKCTGLFGSRLRPKQTCSERIEAFVSNAIGYSAVGYGRRNIRTIPNDKRRSCHMRWAIQPRISLRLLVQKTYLQ